MHLACARDSKEDQVARIERGRKECQEMSLEIKQGTRSCRAWGPLEGSGLYSGDGKPLEGSLCRTDMS